MVIKISFGKSRLKTRKTCLTHRPLKVEIVFHVMYSTPIMAIGIQNQRALKFCPLSDVDKIYNFPVKEKKNEITECS